MIPLISSGGISFRRRSSSSAQKISEMMMMPNSDRKASSRRDLTDRQNNIKMKQKPTKNKEPIHHPEASTYQYIILNLHPNNLYSSIQYQSQSQTCNDSSQDPEICYFRPSHTDIGSQCYGYRGIYIQHPSSIITTRIQCIETSIFISIFI